MYYTSPMTKRERKVPYSVRLLPSQIETMKVAAKLLKVKPAQVLSDALDDYCAGRVNSGCKADDPGPGEPVPTFVYSTHYALPINSADDLLKALWKNLPND